MHEHVHEIHENSDKKSLHQPLLLAQVKGHTKWQREQNSGLLKKKKKAALEFYINKHVFNLKVFQIRWVTERF